MIYLITDWLNNICFDSLNLAYDHIDDISEYLDQAILKESPNLEACENQECCCKALGHECSSLEEEREDYSIEEYNEEADRIMWNGTGYVLKKNYYKGSS